MQIVKKIRDVGAFILINQDNDEGKAKALELQEKAANATAAGMGKPAWEEYMSVFTTEPAELARLNGEDAMMDQPWGKAALTYVVLGGICTMDSLNITANMTEEMIDGLDRDDFNA